MPITKSYQDLPHYTKENFSWGNFLHTAEHYLHLHPTLEQEIRNSCRPTFEAPAHLARPAVNFDNTIFTFTDELLDNIIQNPAHYKKDFTTALTYGFMGTANGGVNGIVRLRDEDQRMQRKVNEYMKTAEQDIQREYGIALPHGTPSTPDHKPAAVEGVKIVCHRKNGLRTIGIRDIRTNHVLFFDRMTYKA